MEVKEENQNKASSRLRSPAYPAISLRDALERIRRVYEQEHEHVADRETIAKAIGYTTLSGAASTVISALKKYGLLEGSNGNLKVSDLAIHIMSYDAGSAERAECLRSSVLGSELFRELLEFYKFKAPSESNLKSYLMRNHFSPVAIKGVTDAFLETLKFLDQEGAAFGVVKFEEASAEKSSPTTTTPTSSMLDSKKVIAPSGTAPLIEFQETLLYRLSSDCRVQVNFEGPVTQKNLDKLIALLQLNKDAFPVDAPVSTGEDIDWGPGPASC